jgi:hypothetical protein
MRTTFKQLQQDVTFRVNEMKLALAGGSGGTWLWVEGNDDLAVLQRYRAPRCVIRVAGNRDAVLDVARQAIRRQIASGYLCLVDADFTDFDSGDQRQPLPGRVARVPVHPDLEGAILYYYNRQLMRGLFSAELARGVPWVEEHPGQFPLDRLIRDVLSPLGALRIAWRKCGLSHHRLDLTDLADSPRDYRDSIVCSLLEQVCASPAERKAELDEVRVLLRRDVDVSDQDWRSLVIHAEDLLRRFDADRWRLVRGKDITVALGWLANRFRECLIHGDRFKSLYDSVRSVQNATLHCIGHEWLHDSGLADELRSKLAAGEELDAFLVAERPSSIAA